MSRKYYPDDYLRVSLKRWLEGISYRAAADLMQVDHANLYRMVNGTDPISEKVGNYLGYTLLDSPQRWISTESK